MEDTITFAPGQPVRDNAQLVGRAAELAAVAGRPPMTPGDARGMLGVRAAVQVSFTPEGVG
jgi:uncharacterized protein (DUF849 family)